MAATKITGPEAEALDGLAEAAQAYLAARSGNRRELAHELRKAGNRFYAIERAAQNSAEAKDAKPKPRDEAKAKAEEASARVVASAVESAQRQSEKHANDANEQPKRKAAKQSA
jgi:hypothetical protein